MGLGIAVNLDLLSLGVAVAANLILGFIIFFKDYRSATNILFLFQTVILSVWSVANYVSYQALDLAAALLAVRLVLFFAVPNSLIFLILMHTFPSDNLRMSKKMLVAIIVLGLITMAVVLSPLVFEKVDFVADSVAPQPTVGPGILLFMLTAVLSVPIGIYFLVRRYIIAEKIERLQLQFVLVGVVIMFALILFLDFICPTFFKITRFIPLSAAMTLPFVIFTAYAIFKHHLLDVKVIATEGAAFLLTIVSLFEVILSNDVNVLLFRSAVFVLTLVFSIFLIRSVLKEVEQREQLQKLSEELKAANAQLEVLSRFKTQLLSLASHQVKSPLAAMKGFVSLIMDGTYGEVNEKVKETLGKVKKSADELIGLINTLLDLRKAEEGKMDYQFAPTDLVPLVSGVVDGLKPLVVEKKLEFTCSAPSEKIMMNADASKLKQVIQNIAENAIKYTPEGFVKVVVEKKDGNALVSVRDSGFGISRDLLPHLFEEFVRDEKVKQKILGTGLGLYIARKIVEAHGGKIWAESEGEGKGSRFYVELGTL